MLFFKNLFTDFGLSRRLEEQRDSGRTNSNIGPVFWMSPEALQQTYSEKSDVWAYGVTLYAQCIQSTISLINLSSFRYEIIAGELPYEGMELIEVGLLVRDKGGNPGVPQKAPKVLAKIMADCWKPNPADRPTFQQICDRLE